MSNDLPKPQWRKKKPEKRYIWFNEANHKKFKENRKAALAYTVVGLGGFGLTVVAFAWANVADPVLSVLPLIWILLFLILTVFWFTEMDRITLLDLAEFLGRTETKQKKAAD
ncbi:MAG: hypothetical protein FJ045_04270 [Crenarchaeota archaeon]|nr:hypothetical protein [Thermoproteota archaeon]